VQAAIGAAILADMAWGITIMAMHGGGHGIVMQ